MQPLATAVCVAIIALLGVAFVASTRLPNRYDDWCMAVNGKTMTGPFPAQNGDVWSWGGPKQVPPAYRPCRK